ncbi:flavodoxin family protein [Cupriavidus basilensis]
MLISIVYDSKYGHTERQAMAVADGVRRIAEAQAEPIAVSLGEIPWERLEASDAIVFGSPTYNGMPSARFKQFMEDSTVVWRRLGWKDKIAAGFTNSASQSGDKLNTLTSFALFAAQHAMVWVGLDLFPGNNKSTGSVADLNRLGSWIGAMAQSDADRGPDSGPIESDLMTAAHLGQRVATITQRLIGR